MSPETILCTWTPCYCLKQMNEWMNLNEWTNLIKWTFLIAHWIYSYHHIEPMSIPTMDNNTSRGMKLPKLIGIMNIEQWSDIIIDAFMIYNVNMVIFEFELKPVIKNPKNITKKECENKEIWWLKSNKAWNLIVTSLIYHIMIELSEFEQLCIIKPHILWHTIQSHYRKKNWTQKWVIVVKMKSLHLKNSDDIKSYMFKVCSILHELKWYEITMENTLTLTVLNWLPIELDLYALNMS